MAYDTLYIDIAQKTEGKLEYAHKLISNLYEKNKQLEKNYSKLLGQKKQYKLVAILFFLILLCGTGIYYFSTKVDEQTEKLSELNKDIKDKTKKNLTLTEQLTRRDNEIASLEERKDHLENRVNTLKKQIAEDKLKMAVLEERKADLELKVNTLEKDIIDLKGQLPQKYKVMVNFANGYMYASGKYESIKYGFEKGDIVKVYTITNGYGLTVAGWVKMRDLSKIY